MKRNPHPARRSRIATLGVSVGAFVSVITSLAWNTHQVELAASVTDATTVPTGSTATTPSATTPVVPSGATPTTPSANIAPTAPSKPSATKNASPATPGVKTVTPATPAVKTTPSPAAVATKSPAKSVVYTCMSPGGTTENPTASGTCKNARYGYVLTQI